jgi:hypothetical protein
MSQSEEVVARGYIQRGWAPIPVPRGKKAPETKGWPNERITESEVERAFGRGRRNIGVLLGTPSGRLVDVDLDCSEALALVREFLPPTGSRFGRKSKRQSHWLYRVTSPVRTKKFADVDAGKKRKETMLVELRSTGAQTIFPGSVHPSGEAIEWDADGEPAIVDPVTLVKAVTMLAVATMLARHWPGEGARNETALAAAGTLLRAGIPS